MGHDAGLGVGAPCEWFGRCAGVRVGGRGERGRDGEEWRRGRLQAAAPGVRRANQGFPLVFGKACTLHHPFAEGAAAAVPRARRHSRRTRVIMSFRPPQAGCGAPRGAHTRVRGRGLACGACLDRAALERSPLRGRRAACPFPCMEPTTCRLPSRISLLRLDRGGRAARGARAAQRKFRGAQRQLLCASGAPATEGASAAQHARQFCVAGSLLDLDACEQAGP